MGTDEQTGRDAVAAIAAIKDPEARARIAHLAIPELRRVRDSALAEVRRGGRGIRPTLEALSALLGVSHQRVSRMIAPPSGALAAYAFRDEAGRWHGEPDRLDGGYTVAWLEFNPVSPSPFAGQRLQVRCGPIEAFGADEVDVVAMRPTRDDGAMIVARGTYLLHSLLFPGHAGAPDGSPSTTTATAGRCWWALWDGGELLGMMSGPAAAGRDEAMAIFTAGTGRAPDGENYRLERCDDERAAALEGWDGKSEQEKAALRPA